jgi:hypothetical protein
MKSTMRRFLFVIATLAALAVPATALADNSKDSSYQESRDESGQVVKFRDDPMDGTGIGPVPGVVKGGTHPKRITLMRPRMNFVGELRKSVENM